MFVVPVLCLTVYVIQWAIESSKLVMMNFVQQRSLMCETRVDIAGCLVGHLLVDLAPGF